MLNFANANDVEKLDIQEVVKRIVTLNEGLTEFWGNAKGWAPLEAAELISRSRLDWQVSLSRSLNRWISELDISLNESIASAEIEQHSRSILSSAHAGIEHPTL